MSRGPGGGGGPEVDDGKADGSFHSPAFLAAHIASLQATERMTYEDFKKKQQAEARLAMEVAAQEDAATLEFRAQLAADREKRMGGGSKKDKGKKRKRDKDKDKKDKKDKKSKKKHKKEKRDKGEKGERKEKKKKRKHDSSSSSSSSSSSESESAEKFRLSNWRAEGSD